MRRSPSMALMLERAIRASVEGVVQGVGFRYATVSVATRLGLTGWVANRPDGSVEVMAQGRGADVAALVEFLHGGPAHARVDRVHLSEVDTDPSLADFAVRTYR